MRARVALSVAALLALVSAQLAVVAYAQTENDTLEKISGTAERLADWMKTIAYVVLIIGAFVGVVNYMMGKGPEWLGRVAAAAILVAVVLWIIGQVFPK